MSKRIIVVEGCDDTTEVLIDLTDDEYAVVLKLTAAVNAAKQRGCMPEIQTATEGDPDYLELLKFAEIDDE